MSVQSLDFNIYMIIFFDTPSFCFVFSWFCSFERLQCIVKLFLQPLCITKTFNVSCIYNKGFSANQ